MKLRSIPHHPATCQTRWRSLFCATAVCASVPLFIAGCSKSAQSPGTDASKTPQITNASAAAANANESQPAPPSHPAPAVPKTSANGAAPDLQSLNRALLNWTIQNHRHPRNFEDFAASANIQIPPPPAGKKYTLNAKGFIVLVPN